MPEKTTVETNSTPSDKGSDSDAMLDSLRARIKAQDELLELYREMTGRLAVAKNKNEAWALMMCWWSHTRTIGFDLKTEEEQKAFIFGV